MSMDLQIALEVESLPASTRVLGASLCEKITVIKGGMIRTSFGRGALRRKGPLPQMLPYWLGLFIHIC